MPNRTLLVLAAAAILPTVTLAEGPEIVAATAARQGETWRFDVTLHHPDTGWDHYADGWEVAAPDGTRLGFRELLHPHVEEQPFTRSLTGIAIPEDIDTVTIRARCNVEGWGEETLRVTLPDQ